jgi:uncharacterized membrane protein YfcA
MSESVDTLATVVLWHDYIIPDIIAGALLVGVVVYYLGAYLVDKVKSRRK